MIWYDRRAGGSYRSEARESKERSVYLNGVEPGGSRPRGVGPAAGRRWLRRAGGDSTTA